MLQGLHAEIQKAKRRHDLLICLLIPLAALLWSAYSAPDGGDDLRVGYHALLYTFPVMNTVLMPVGMAMLASRLWDVEVKGNTPKLLYTLQRRRSLFAAKVLLGMAELSVIVSVEVLGIWILGQVLGYLDTPPLVQFAYSFLCTYTVDLMLFFSELLLTILLQNPLPALCTGIAGSLIGLFSAFMPPVVGYFVPWGYFIPLTTYVLIDWDPDTRAVLYGIREFRPLLLLWCAVLALLFFCITWRAIREKEV